MAAVRADDPAGAASAAAMTPPQTATPSSPLASRTLSPGFAIGLALLVLLGGLSILGVSWLPSSPAAQALPAWSVAVFAALFVAAQLLPILPSPITSVNSSAAVLTALLLVGGAPAAVDVVALGQLVTGLKVAHGNWRRGGPAALRQRLPGNLADYINNVVIKCVAVACAGVLLTLIPGVPWDGVTRPWPSVVCVGPVAALVTVYTVLDDLTMCFWLGISGPAAITRRVAAGLRGALPWQLAMAFLGLLGALLYTSGFEWTVGLFAFVFGLQRAYRQHTRLQQASDEASGTLRKAVQAIAGERAPDGAGTPPQRAIEPDGSNLVLYSRLVAEQLDRDREMLLFKDEFMSIVSHELRTPLTVLSGTVDVMIIKRVRHDPDDPLLPELRRLKAQTNQLTAILDVVLDQARHKADVFTVTPVELDLVAVVRLAVDGFSTMMQAHPIELSAPGSLILAADAPRLAQVLNNLLSNACKYSPVGAPVRVTVTQDDQQAVIAVSDQGIGIPADEQVHVFARFQRASNVGRAPGLGAGLYVSQAIVERHGGHIWLESAVGQGSTFYVALPLRQQDCPPDP